SGGNEEVLTLKDTLGGQRLSLSRPGTAYWVQLIVESIYAGSAYPETAISELRVISDSAPVSPPSTIASAHVAPSSSPTPPPTGAPFVPVTLWSHNESIVRLTAEGASRKFHYEKPRPGIMEAGAFRGTLLFEGHRHGDRYVGTAYVFAGKCG